MNKPDISPESGNGLSLEEFLVGLPERTRGAIESLRKKPSVSPRILSIRATDNTAIQFGEIEAVLGNHGFNTTQIIEAAISTLYKRMKDDGLLK